MRNQSQALIVVLVLFSSSLWGKDSPPYAWPVPPDADTVTKAMAMKSDSGLVILQRDNHLQLNSFGTFPMGVRKDGFTRILIVNEEGVKRSSWTVQDDLGSAIEVLEARTISPEGVICALDPKKDVTQLDLTSIDKKDRLSSIATVRIPAPRKQMILDLHVVTFHPGWVFYHIQTLALPDTPLLSQDVDISITGGFPRVPWAILTLGDKMGVGKLTSEGPGRLHAHVGSYQPAGSEPYSPPDIQCEGTLLCYMNFAAADSKEIKTGVAYRNDCSIDPKGRLEGLQFEPAPLKEWWTNYLKDIDKASNDFIKHAGAAEELDVLSVAPTSLPLEERLAKIYKLVQGRVTYNPDAEDVKSLAVMMKKGMNSRWQGALLMRYLLNKAQIQSKVAMIADRYYVRFSPLITNQYLFALEEAILVDVPGKGPLFMMPGDLALPFGCLPVSRQGALAILLGDGDTVKSIYTPMDVNTGDAKNFRFEVTLDSDGNAKGTMTLAESGAPARDFYLWNVDREFRATHPSKKDKKGNAAGDKERREALEKSLANEMIVPGDRVQQENFTLSRSPKGPDETVEIKSGLFLKGLAQKAGDTWLMRASPLLAGLQNPFLQPRRTLPIWYDSGGRFVFEGVIHLPKGATVSELPKIAEITGPEGAGGRCNMEVAQQDGVVTVRTRFEYYQPLVIGYDHYGSWKTYQNELARACAAQCVIALPPAEKDLE